MAELTLYDCLESGNGHKVRLLMSLLDIEYDLVLKDIHAGETRTKDYLRLNPAGRIPLLQLSDGRTLPESNAILFYLAEGTPYLPDDRFARAQVVSWLMFEQYQHEPNIAVARFWCHHLEMTDDRAPGQVKIPNRIEHLVAHELVSVAQPLLIHDLVPVDHNGIIERTATRQPHGPQLVDLMHETEGPCPTHIALESTLGDLGKPLLATDQRLAEVDFEPDGKARARR